MNPINAPLVTVYIPTYNRASMVVNSIESVINQSYSNIEIIVVNDNSVDNTKQVLSKYLKLNNFIYIENIERLGACASRNKAIFAANGELITGLDDDDLFKSERIKELVLAFNKMDVSCIATCTTERTQIGDIERTFECGEITLNKLLHHNSLGNQVLTKTDFLKQIGGFDQAMPAFQDYDTWVRLINEFGVAYKIKSCSYIWNTAHNIERISTNKNSVRNGFDAFYEKHMSKMTSAHNNTYQVLKLRLYDEDFSFLDFIKYTRNYNWKQSTTLFIKNNIPKLSSLIHRLRAK